MSDLTIEGEIINLAKLSYDFNIGKNQNKIDIDNQIQKVTILLNGGWICSVCTFINVTSDRKCSMCNTAKQVSSSSSADLPAVTIVMRHGVRADSGPPDGNEKSWSDVITNWPDRLFDPPVGNTKFMQETADEYKSKFAKITKIVSSPFRRCLETATFLASQLDINTIYINDNLGEKGSAIKPTDKYTKHTIDELQKIINDFCTFLSYSKNIIIIQDNKGEWNDGKIWNQKESIYETIRRFESVINEEKRFFLENNKNNESLLIVSHADAVNHFATPIPPNSKDLMAVEFCGYITIDNKTGNLSNGTGITGLLSSIN